MNFTHARNHLLFLLGEFLLVLLLLDISDRVQLHTHSETIGWTSGLIAVLALPIIAFYHTAKLTKPLRPAVARWLLVIVAGFGISSLLIYGAAAFADRDFCAVQTDTSYSACMNLANSGLRGSSPIDPGTIN